MVKRTILLSDIHALLQTFLPGEKEIYLFDPELRLKEDISFETLRHGKGPLVLINLAQKINSFKGHRLEDFDLILDFGKGLEVRNHSVRKWNFIQANGRLRWFFAPGNLSKILAFYNQGSARAKLLGWALKALHFTKMEWLAPGGRLTVFSKEVDRLTAFENEIEADGSCLFLGTAGTGRTPVVAFHKNEMTMAFGKVALGWAGMQLINEERQALKRINARDWSQILVPREIKAQDPRVLLTNNIFPQKGRRLASFGALHANALVEMGKQCWTCMPLQSTHYWEESAEVVNQLKRSNPRINLNFLINNLGLLRANMQESKLVYSGLGHGDFTPWNMFATDNRLHVYDWEMSRIALPAFYDLFHFHFQQGALVDGKSFVEIQREIQKSWTLQPIQEMANCYGLDWEEQLRYYLLCAVPHLLAGFELERLSANQHALIALWEEALSQMVPQSFGRQAFLESFNARLATLKHAFLKFNVASLRDLPLESDLDLVIEKKDRSTLLAFCKNSPGLAKMKLRSKSFMSIVELYFQDGSFLSIDLIHGFKRRALTMMETAPMLDGVREKNGIRLPQLRYDLEYCLLFYTKNGSAIPIKYFTLFSAYAEEEKQEALAYLNAKYRLDLTHFAALFQYVPSRPQKLEDFLRKQSFRSPLNKLQDVLGYVGDLLGSILVKRGFMITFSGVDGAGKSTIIALVKAELEKKYRREVVLKRHRPGILPMLNAWKVGAKKAEELASTRLPRQGGNKSAAASLFRFAYYFADYFLGQLYVYFRYVLRGKVVVYDRYYFDFIGDAKRSNIQLNSALVKWLYRFVAHPRLNFFLYAQPETILARKKELKSGEIRELTAGYQKLFRELAEKEEKGKYRMVENVEIEQTLSTIMTAYSQIA